MTGTVTAQELQRWILPLLQLCREAGEVICEHYDAPGAHVFEPKGDDSPLTRADLASHAVLQLGLQALAPGIPVLSEESVPADIAGRRQWRRYWLVDPLDGTREFLGRTGEFTINIAFVDDHRAMLGVLYLPLLRLGYVGVPGVEAHCYRASGTDSWTASELATRTLQGNQAMVVLASRRHSDSHLQPCMDWLGAHWGTAVERRNMGGALKFCAMAQGEGDFYPRFSPCCEWDTAAGQAVLEAAGGRVLGMDGEPLRYNCSDSLYSPPFYAVADCDHPLWRRLIHAKLA